MEPVIAPKYDHGIVRQSRRIEGRGTKERVRRCRSSSGRRLSIKLVREGLQRGDCHCAFSKGCRARRGGPDGVMS